jgi:Ca2+-binding RTX toxin-like protein
MAELGVYVGNDPAGVAQFEAWLGKPVDGVLGYIGNASWSDFSSGYSDWLWSSIDKKVFWSVPLIVNGANLADAANGAYDGYWRTVAQQLADNRPQDATIDIRTGWEFNGDWFPWTAAGGKEADFAAAFRHFVDVFRSVEGGERFRFEWNIASGVGAGNPERAYPGDAWVDVIGADFYWHPQWEGTDPVRAWDIEVSQYFGLQWLEDFAKAHNKPTAYSEWGVPGGLDASVYIDKAKAWFESHNVDFHTYWNGLADSGYDGKLTDNSDPGSVDAFRRNFGAGSTTNPNPNPNPDPTPVQPPAGATLIGFDTVTLADGGEQVLAGSLNGFTFAQAGVHNPVAGSGYATASGSNLAFFAEATGTEVNGYAGAAGSPMVIKRADGADFTFHGANFSAVVDGLKITAQGYDNGALVGSFTVTASRGTAPFVSFDGATRFSSIDEVRLDAPGYFGLDNFAFSAVEAAPGPLPDPITPTPGITLGSGTDKLVLKVSEDAALGDAKFTVSVDGQQIGGTLTATALHATGQSNTVTLLGEWAPGTHSVSVNFLNDYYGGSAATDRNLYVDSLTYNGVAVAGAPAGLYSTGAKSFSFVDSTPVGAPAVPAPTYAKVLLGDGTANTLVGGTGADRIEGGGGSDRLTGGAAADVFVFAKGTGADIVTDFQSGIDKLVFQGFEASQIKVASVTGGLRLTDGFGDSVTLQGVTKLAAGDILGAPVSLRGTSGVDTLDRSTATGPAKLAGLAGDDVLKGGSGADWLVGGQGRDVLTGGGGADDFVFSRGDGFDRVTDFASGLDQLVLRGIDPASVKASWATQGGVAGIDIGYGTAGDHVFLAGATALGAGDLVFA